MSNLTREELLKRLEGPGNYRPGAGPLDWNDIGFLVYGFALAGRPLQKATERVTERYDLGPRGAWLINIISSGITYPHLLAEVVRISRSLISNELSRLTQAGLITRKPGSKDRRSTELMLTDLGRETLEEIRGELRAIVTQGLVHYTPDQVRLCAQMLSDLRDYCRDDATHSGNS